MIIKFRETIMINNEDDKNVNIFELMIRTKTG